MSPGDTSGCAVREGFFVLRDCGHAAQSTCDGCGRSICARHVAQDGRCVECAAQSQLEDNTDDGLWVWYTRHRAVEQHGLRPFYDGSVAGTDYYDAWDLRPLQAASAAVSADGADDDDVFDS